jgi:hypothetical protein
MDMTINITNGVETCAHFCPLLPGEGLDGLALDPNATDEGAVTWQGQPAEQYVILTLNLHHNQNPNPDLDPNRNF